jgi:hypothetical protein
MRPQLESFIFLSVSFDQTFLFQLFLLIKLFFLKEKFGKKSLERKKATFSPLFAPDSRYHRLYGRMHLTPFSPSPQAEVASLRSNQGEGVGGRGASIGSVYHHHIKNKETKKWRGYHILSYFAPLVYRLCCSR